jgi:hypothetical protein
MARESKRETEIRVLRELVKVLPELMQVFAYETKHLTNDQRHAVIRMGVDLMAELESRACELEKK